MYITSLSFTFYCRKDFYIKTTILFDLDGTLTDSAPGIIETMQYALNKKGIIPPDDLHFILGPPLIDTFINTFHMSQQSAKEAYQYYYKRYAEKGMYQNSVFEGVKEMLSELKKHGKKLAVATSKSENFANEIIEHFELSEYFDCIAGNHLNTRDTKAKVVCYALEQLQCNPESAILVGDRMYDIIGGKTAGVNVIGVLYGYGEMQELQQYGADAIAKTPQDVVEIILNWYKRTEPFY